LTEHTEHKASDFNIPNFLTVLRVLLIPVIAACFYKPSELTRWVAVSIFLFACLTDYLDGYIARTYRQMTKFGQILDPIADKLLVASTLLLMAGFDKLTKWGLIPAIIILCREMLISGFREFLSDLRVTLPVSNLAKFKTAAQMVAITLLLICDLYQDQRLLAHTGEIFLWLASVLSIVTGLSYYRETMKYI
jgi:cardiolipin synthase